MPLLFRAAPDCPPNPRRASLYPGSSHCPPSMDPYIEVSSPVHPGPFWTWPPGFPRQGHGQLSGWDRELGRSSVLSQHPRLRDSGYSLSLFLPTGFYPPSLHHTSCVCLLLSTLKHSSHSARAPCSPELCAPLDRPSVSPRQTLYHKLSPVGHLGSRPQPQEGPDP